MLSLQELKESQEVLHECSLCKNRYMGKYGEANLKKHVQDKHSRPTDPTNVPSGAKPREPTSQNRLDYLDFARYLRKTYDVDVLDAEIVSPSDQERQKGPRYLRQAFPPNLFAM